MSPQFKTTWLMITGGDIVLPGGDVFAGGTVLVNNGIIRDITEKAAASLLLDQEDVSVIDATGLWVTPGLIDQHIHGAFGVDFNQSSISEIHELLTRLPMEGITGVLPTLMTAPKLDMVFGLSRLEEVIHTLQQDEAKVFGIHLEGPFLHPNYRGAHPLEDLLSPTEENLEGLVSPSLKRITLSPELDPDCSLIKLLSEHGILCSIGHSGADYLTSVKAAEAGALSVTHLFNAMSHIDHRKPGIALAALLKNELFIELVTDGQHLSPFIVELVLRVKPFEKVIVISDCNALVGMPIGSSMKIGKQTVTIEREGALNEEGRLAGSTKLVTDSVRNLVNWGILSFPHAVQLATLHPADYLGKSPLFGQIAPDAVADLVLWRKEDLSIDSVILSGNLLSVPEKRT